MSAPRPQVSLPLFDGPLDLLLELVRRKEVDIADIPIAEITRQYLDYLRQAGELNIDLGSDFVYMAALLIHIKSRCLLPPDPEPATAAEDPRAGLVRQLLDHDQVRRGAEFLKQQLELASAAWPRPQDPPFTADSAAALPRPEGVFNLLEVLRLTRQALATARTHEIIASDPVTVEQMIRWLDRRLPPSPQSIEAAAVFAEQPDREHQAALFLGVLEMAKAGRICLDQQECFGPLWLTAFFVTAPPCRNEEQNGEFHHCAET